MKLKNALILFCLSAIPVSAFAINFPSGLSWKIMPEVTFNYANTTGTKEQRETVKTIWRNKLKASDTAFSLLANAATQENNYYFSMLNSETSGCIAAPNGDGENLEPDAYSTCSMRVVQQNKISKQVKVQDLQNYCYLNLNDEPGELAKNHTEFAYDSKSKTVYFRTIMYGKHAPACDRAIRLK